MDYYHLYLVLLHKLFRHHLSIHLYLLCRLYNLFDYFHILLNEILFQIPFLRDIKEVFFFGIKRLKMPIMHIQKNWGFKKDTQEELMYNLKESDVLAFFIMIILLNKLY